MKKRKGTMYVPTRYIMSYVSNDKPLAIVVVTYTISSKLVCGFSVSHSRSNPRDPEYWQNS